MKVAIVSRARLFWSYSFSDAPSYRLNYRIIITSRPEQDIELLRDNPETIQYIRMGDIATEETLLDIQSFVSNRLQPIAPTLNKIQENWAQILAKRAEGLFQWADTACRCIDPNVRYLSITLKRWTTCVSSSSCSLFKLYEDIISSQQESQDPQFFDSFQTIVSAIIMAREPLSVDALQNILQETIPDVREVLYPFGSLFHGVNDLSTPIQPLHTSLFDFFADSSTKYHIDVSVQASLTLGCLQIMNRTLRFNICDLETSHVSNQDVPNFSERVAAAIPSHLRYACRFWALHLNALHSTEKAVIDKIVAQIRILMEEKLLFWFEVHSLLNDIKQGCLVMLHLKDWLPNADSDFETLATQASDAYNFGSTFIEAMSGSTPHLYLSALPFAPRNSFISKQYLPRYPHLFSIDIDQSVDFAPEEVCVTKRHTSSVLITCLAFSSHDRYIATGFESGEITLMDYTTGEQINQWKPNNENSGVGNIVFSPNGELLYGCFPEEGRLVIWNIKTNEIVQEDYHSHVKSSCRFSTVSSDGRYIAFDYDYDVLLYDRTRRTIIHRFLCDKFYRIRIGFQFSPSGILFAFVKEIKNMNSWIKMTLPDKVIVNLWNTQEQAHVRSWSDSHELALSDNYIVVLKSNWDGCEVWESTTMKLIHRFANGYPITHIRLSANDQYLLAGGRNAYRIWTLSTGQMKHQSHTDGFISNLALSPDSNYIALTDSYDAGTTYIRQWTPRNLQHSSPVNDNRTLEDSPVENLWLHGDYLVLHLESGLLQIWDIKTTNTVVFEAMIGKSSMTVFSVDEEVYVAYGVHNEELCELCLWNKSEGQRVLDKLGGTVAAVAFSPSNAYLIFGVNGLFPSFEDYYNVDRHRGTLKIWDVRQSRFAVQAPSSVEGTVKTLAFSSSGAHVLVAYIKNYCRDAYFEIRKCHLGLPVSTGPFKCSVHSNFSADHQDQIVFSTNKVLFISYNGVEIFDATTGKEVRCIECAQFSFQGWPSPDGKYFAWLNWKDNELKLLDVDNDKLLLQQSSEQYNLTSILLFSNDSTQLIAFTRPDAHNTSLDHRCYNITQVWDVQTKNPVIENVRHLANDYSYLPALHNGHLVLGSYHSPRTVWSFQALSAATKRYDDHVAEAVFGTFPVT